MRRDAALAPGETYHIYNRGAHKQKIFTTEADYVRFLLLLHISNTTGKVNTRDLLAKYKGQAFVDIFLMEKPDKTLVDVLGFCLMPNHFHLILQQKADKGVHTFLHKLFTAYSMYFNAKYDHSGILSQGPFKSKHVNNESYFRYIFSYVHLNPLSLIEPGWETGVWKDKDAAVLFLREYQYSSYYDYSVANRPERAILAYENRPDFLDSQNDLEDLLLWSADPEGFTKARPL